MRHELAQRDRDARAVVGCEVGEVVPHGGVDVDLLPLDELQDRDVGEQLRHGTNPVHGLGGRGDAGFLFAEALRPDDAPVVDERDRHRRQVLLRTLALDHGGERGRYFGVATLYADGGCAFVRRFSACQEKEREEQEGQEIHTGATGQAPPVFA